MSEWIRRMFIDQTAASWDHRRIEGIKALERRARLLEAEQEIAGEIVIRRGGLDHMEAYARRERLRDYADAQDLEG